MLRLETSVHQKESRYGRNTFVSRRPDGVSSALQPPALHAELRLNHPRPSVRPTLHSHLALRQKKYTPAHPTTYFPLTQRLSSRLADYDWRAQEHHFNTTLPQFRTTIPLGDELLRVHFVHQPCRLGDLTPPRTTDVTVIPLLWCHDVPASSFLDVSRVVGALASCVEGFDGVVDKGGVVQVEGGGRRGVAFHVVAPSVPGTGFSDGSGEEGFGAWETAEVFDGLMRRLGYGRYVAFGAGW